MRSGTNSPASPHLASALLNLSSPALHTSPASSGSGFIDTSALEGGYHYGEITCIAGATGTGKTLLGYHSIASHLLAEDEKQGSQVGPRAGRDVASIDTTGDFSVRKLRDVLVSRMCNRSHGRAEGGETRTLESKAENLQKATEMLGRVRVMRVFDLVGIMEALGEIGEQAAEERKARQHIRGREIGDSEDEDEDEDDIGDMKAQREEADGGRNGHHGYPIGMIVIDTLSNVVSSLVSRSPIQGQALLTNCMRSLRNITARHQICTVLLNSVVGLNPSSDALHRRNPEENVSIFASSIGKPALGKVFAYSIDVSILLSLVPKTQVDATAAYGDTSRDRPWTKAIVLEVLKDKGSTREARWAAFEIANSVELVPCFT